MTFVQDITKFVEKTKLSGALIVKKLAFDAFRGVILRSPVDTGRFRASWRIGLDTIDSSESGPTGATPGKHEGQSVPPDFSETAKLTGVVWGGTVYITNNVDYAIDLERGTSKQAPAGVMAITFEQIKNDFAATVASVSNSP